MFDCWELLWFGGVVVDVSFMFVGSVVGLVVSPMMITELGWPSVFWVRA